jgi:hypothetical protein
VGRRESLASCPYRIRQTWLSPACSRTGISQRPRFPESAGERARPRDVAGHLSPCLLPLPEAPGLTQSPLSNEWSRSGPKTPLFGPEESSPTPALLSVAGVRRHLLVSGLRLLVATVATGPAPWRTVPAHVAGCANFLSRDSQPRVARRRRGAVRAAV